MPFPFRRTALALAFAAVPIAAVAGVVNLPRAAATPTHFVAHQMCAAVFISGVEPGRYYDEALATNVRPVGGAITHRIDREKREVTASFMGLVHSRAVYRGETGCVVDQGRRPADPLSPAARAPALLPSIAGPAVVTPTDPALSAALDRAFAEDAQGPRRNTHAILVVHDGKVIAERYSAGYGPQTPIHGWSMTKSVTATLIGVLVREGRLRTDAPAPVPQWTDAKDPRRQITVDNLLRMSSGLDLGDSLNISVKDAFSPSSQVLFAEPDMAAFSAAQRLQVKPGTRFTYANGNTLLLSQILRDQAGGTGQAVVDFTHRELFDKLGLEHPVLAQDAVGTPIGASQMWATARDWARLGVLYANDGVVGGERILPAGWMDYVTRLTPGSEIYGYGAGFWTNRGVSAGARNRPHMPADSFMARGSHGQYTIVVPSAKLVVVRLGDAYTHYDDIATVDRLVGDVLAVVGRHAGQPG